MFLKNKLIFNYHYLIIYYLLKMYLFNTVLSNTIYF